MAAFGYEPRVQSWSPNEKDHKLLQLLSSQQIRGRSKAGLTGAQRARTGPPLNQPASPTPSINLLGPGKVRQMFEERRNNSKGIDKANPLEPILNKSRGSSPATSPTSFNTITNVGSSRKTPSPAPLKILPMTTNGETISKSGANKKIPSNSTASRSSLFDNNTIISLPRPSSLDSLHNLGVLPRSTKYVDYAEEFETTVRMKEAELKDKLRGLKGLEVVEKGAADLIGSPGVRLAIMPPGKTKPTKGGAPAEVPPLKSSPPPGTEPCPICSRSFALDRLAKHQSICKKTKQKKRPAFDPHSLARTELGIDGQSVQPDRTIPKPPNNNKINKKLVGGNGGKQNWRSKHDDFIKTIRAAKEYSNHVNNGGDPNDLPPMPDSDYSDYLICPHCERRFGPKAAERHISICGGIKSNK